jgi:integrase
MASVQRRGNGSFLLVVEAGYDAKGKRIRRTKTVKCKGITEARLELAKFQVEVEAGEYISPEKMKFSLFVEEWRKKYGEKNLSPTTLKVYNDHLKNHILPNFGHMALDKIKTIQLINFFDELSKPGSRKDGKDSSLSDGTIQYIYKIMRNIFKRAKEWKLVKNNLMEEVQNPKVEKKEMKYMEGEEAKTLIDALYQEPTMWRICFLTALIGGMRRAELIALEWSDIDFENQAIYINKSIPLTKDGKAVIRKPKANSTRIVDMPTWYMEELERFQNEWEEEKERVGDLWEEENHEFIFHSGFGIPLHYNAPTYKWIKFKNKHAIKDIRLHDLRHTMVTLLIEAGANMKAIQKRAGHSSLKITSDTYGHVTKKISRLTADKFDDFAPKK